MSTNSRCNSKPFEGTVGVMSQRTFHEGINSAYRYTFTQVIEAYIYINTLFSEVLVFVYVFVFGDDLGSTWGPLGVWGPLGDQLRHVCC